MMVLVLLGTALAVYALARTLFGPGAGLLSLALAALHPSLLAHGHLVATDLPITFCAALVLPRIRGPAPAYHLAPCAGRRHSAGSRGAGQALVAAAPPGRRGDAGRGAGAEADGRTDRVRARHAARAAGAHLAGLLRAYRAADLGWDLDRLRLEKHPNCAAAADRHCRKPASRGRRMSATWPAVGTKRSTTATVSRGPAFFPGCCASPWTGTFCLNRTSTGWRLPSTARSIGTAYFLRRNLQSRLASVFSTDVRHQDADSHTAIAGGGFDSVGGAPHTDPGSGVGSAAVSRSSSCTPGTLSLARSTLDEPASAPRVSVAPRAGWRCHAGWLRPAAHRVKVNSRSRNRTHAPRPRRKRGPGSGLPRAQPRRSPGCLSRTLRIRPHYPRVFQRSRRRAAAGL